MKRRVQVYYNLLFLDPKEPIRRMLEGYQKGDRLRPIAEVEIESTGSIEADLELVWRMFNRVDDSELERFLPEKERSMSMGDIIHLPDDNMSYAVRTFGFDPVRVPKKLMPPFEKVTHG